MLVPSVGVTITDPKPSKALPGFSEIGVSLAYSGSTKDETFSLSADGQTVIPGATSSVPAFNLKGNPFQINLDKLFTANQPSFGPAAGSVTVVEFGDFECPSCRAEAPILRQLLPNFQPGKVRVEVKGRTEDFVANVVDDSPELVTGTHVLVVAEGAPGALLVAKHEV